MKFALIGCGGIGQLRAAALAQAAGQKLIAVSDVDPTRAAAVAQKHGAKAYQELPGLLANEQVEAVIIATPPDSHAELAIAALQAGKHVLCEKPLARSVAEAEQMVAVARDTGCFLATGFNYRFYPSILLARELLDSGLIGRLNHIRSYTGYSALDHDQAWLHDADIMGGGALRDNGIHLIDLTAYFLGDVVETKGYRSNSVWSFPGCEDNGFALMRNATGQIATLQASWTEWRGYRLLVELYGERGCIRAWCFPMMVQSIWSDEVGGRMRRKWALFPKVQIMEKLRSYRWVVAESFVKELTAFERAAQGHHTRIARGKDGLLTLRVAEATKAV